MSEYAAAGAAAMQLLGGYIGYRGQTAANKTNIGLSREQMQFEEKMANTSYQRAVKDMQVAGLNPMLAYSQGGAPVPQYTRANVENALAPYQASAKGAGDSMLAAAGVEQSRAQTRQLEAGTEKIRSETMEHDANSALLAAQTQKTWNESYRTAGETPGKEAESRAKVLGLNADIAANSFSADSARRKAESLTAGEEYRRKGAEADLTEMERARGRAEEKFYAGMGGYSPYVRSLLEILKGAQSIHSLRR